VRFGGDTVGFKTITETGEPDELGQKSKTPSTVWIPGCRHRPLKASETPEGLTNTKTQIWKTTAPPEADAAAAASTGVLVFGADEFKIIGGAEPFTDHTGALFKVTILSSKV
jgi:hypothetical protein